MSDIAARPDVKQFVQETQVLAQASLGFKIKTNVSYTLAAEELKRIKGAAKQLEELRTSITKPMDEAKRAVMDLFREPATWLENAETSIKGEMLAYRAELDRREREAARVAEEAARAERERIALEAARAAEEGRHEDARAAAERICEVVPVIQPMRPKPIVAGQREVELWQFEVIDPAKVKPEFMIVDMQKLGKLVRSLKGDAQAIVGEGVRVYMSKTLASTGT